MTAEQPRPVRSGLLFSRLPVTFQDALRDEVTQGWPRIRGDRPSIKVLSICPITVAPHPRG